MKDGGMLVWLKLFTLGALCGARHFGVGLEGRLGDTRRRGEEFMDPMTVCCRCVYEADALGQAQWGQLAWASYHERDIVTSNFLSSALLQNMVQSLILLPSSYC